MTEEPTKPEKQPIKPPPRKQLPPIDLKDIYFIIIGIIIVLTIYAANWLSH